MNAHLFSDEPRAMESVTLRQWRESDLELYVGMNRDPEVMRYFPALLEREQSVASYERQRRLIDERGWGLWAVDVDGEFAGFTGLSVPTFTARFTPCVEIGWRLRRAFWGRSIAYRAALQALDHGFRVAQLPGLVSFTAVINTPSRRFMERLGLTHDPIDDFDHPSIAKDSPLRRHVLYRAVPPQARGSVGAPIPWSTHRGTLASPAVGLRATSNRSVLIPVLPRAESPRGGLSPPASTVVHENSPEISSHRRGPRTHAKPECHRL